MSADWYTLYTSSLKYGISCHVYFPFDPARTGADRWKSTALDTDVAKPLSQIAPIISCVGSEAVCRMYYSACGIMGHNFVRSSCLIKVYSHWYRGRGWFFSGIRQNGDLSGPIWCCDSRWALCDKNWPWPWGGTVMVRLDDKKRPVKRPACHPGSRVLLIQGRGTHTYRTIL